jgi:replicative DNA helicase
MTEWEPPIAFEDFDLAIFPLEALPGWFRKWVAAEAVRTQTPPDLAAWMGLAAIATSMAKKVVVVIKAEWTQPVNIYVVVVLPPATRKSPVFETAVEPLERFMQEEARRMAPEIEDASTLKRIAAKRLKRAEDKAAKVPDEKCDDLEETAKNLAREYAAIVVPESVRLLADDVTPERLVALLAAHGGRIAILSDEGTVFDLMAGRYSKDNSPNFDVYLKGWDGGALRVDRVSRAPEYVRKPSITIGMTVQPAVMHGLVQKAGFRGKGLPARFFYSIPRSTVGHRQTNPPQMPPDVRASYQRAIAALLALQPGTDEHGESRPHEIIFTADARVVLDRFQTELEPELRDTGGLGAISDWGGKLVGGIARLAGLLHITQFADRKAPWEVPVEAQTVADAIKIGRYLIPHAKAAFAQMGADPQIELAKQILRWVRDKRKESFTARDAYQAMGGRVKLMEEMAGPLGVLLEHRYIRRVPPPDEPRGPGRPPSPDYEVNPEWLLQNPQNPQNPTPGGNSEDIGDIEDGDPSEIELAGEEGFV